MGWLGAGDRWCDELTDHAGGRVALEGPQAGEAGELDGGELVDGGAAQALEGAVLGEHGLVEEGALDPLQEGVARHDGPAEVEEDAGDNRDGHAAEEGQEADAREHQGVDPEARHARLHHAADLFAGALLWRFGALWEGGMDGSVGWVVG